MINRFYLIGGITINKEICKLLIQLRNLRGITQQELADQVGYSRRQIARIESGEIEISKDAAVTLSSFYKIDISHYLDVNSSFKSVSSYEEFINLRMLIEKQDIDGMISSYTRLENDKEFQTGEKLQVVLYAKALIKSVVEKNYVESNRLCFTALAELGYTDYVKSLRTEILNDMSYPVLFNIGFNYSKLKQHDLLEEITLEIYDHFENTVFHNPIPLRSDMYNMKKYYIISMNNLADMHSIAQEYEAALALVEKGIQKSADFSISAVLYALTQLRFKIYYMLNDIESAKKYYKTFQIICETTGFIDYFNNFKSVVEEKYRLLLN